MNALRGGSGNEAKNERLRVRWLGSAVTELQSEVAEVLRARNASEELAERSRMRSELTLLKGDVAEVGRSIRDLGGRITKIEAALGTIRLDITATKEHASLLSRSCADVNSQVSLVALSQILVNKTVTREKYKALGNEINNSSRFATQETFKKITRDLFVCI